MRASLRGRILPALLVVLALGAVYGAGSLRHPAASAASAASRPGRAPVVSALRACPAPGSTGVTAGGVALAAAPGSAGQGQAVISRLIPAGASTAGPAVSSVTAPGQLQLLPVTAAPAVPKALAAGQAGSSAAVRTSAGRGGILIQATGALAQGIEAEQTGPGGLVTARCEAPGTSFWFVGPGQKSAAQIEVYLINPDGQAADAQVSALTDENPLVSSDTGIAVPPHSMVVQSLNALLSSSQVIALHVSTSVGRVSAAVRLARSPSEPGGWLPAAQQPARNLVIPGVPGTTGTRVLYVAVPGGSGSAQVKITAVTAKGSYQPTGGSGIDLPGSSAWAVQLPSRSGVAAAIRVSASVPVTAAISVPGGAAGAPAALAVASAPVQQQGVIADNPAGPAGSAELVLSAPWAAASVRVTDATATVPFGREPSTTVQVAAGHTAVLPLRTPPGVKAGDFAVLVTPLPGSGLVYAGRVLTAGGVTQSILPVISSPTWVALPAVGESMTALGS